MTGCVLHVDGHVRTRYKPVSVGVLCVLCVLCVLYVLYVCKCFDVRLDSHLRGKERESRGGVGRVGRVGRVGEI